MISPARVDEHGGAATPGTARGGKGDRTRSRILDAAAALFARRGVAAVSMGEVAKDVGLQAGSLYFHFPSKAALAAEVLDRGLADGLAFVEVAVDSAADSAATRLGVAIEAHLVALHRVSDYASVIAQAVAMRGFDSGATAPTLERRYAAMWLQLLDDARAAGALRADLDPRLVRDLLFGAMNSPTMRNRDPHEVARTLAGLIGLES